jgi:hypothetical protein
MSIQDLLRDQRPSDEESEGGEIAIEIHISAYSLISRGRGGGDGGNVQHGGIPYMFDLLPPVCLRGSLREGKALEGVRLDGSRDGAYAGED